MPRLVPNTEDREVTMTSTPLTSGSTAKCTTNNSLLFHQLLPPVEAKHHGTYSFLKSMTATLYMERNGKTATKHGCGCNDGKARRKVQNYDQASLSTWRALFTLAHTAIVDPSTYQLLFFLVFVTASSFLVLNATGMAQSIEDDGIVSTRLLYLLSFVLAGHVSFSVQRWYALRHAVWGPSWGALESLFLLSCQLSPNNFALQETVLRHARLVMRLVFRAGQQVEDLSDLELEIEGGILLPRERVLLEKLQPGTRPLAVTAWMSRELEDEYARTVNQVKGGIGGVLAYIGCPLPFQYVHLVNWTVLFSLLTLSVSTGIILAIGWERRENGNNQYHPPLEVTWPANPGHWYLNYALTYTVQNVLYGIFSLGLVRVCAKLHNPFSKDDSAFPEHSYDAFLYNNCRALQAGYCVDLDLDSKDKDNIPLATPVATLTPESSLPR